MGQPFHSSLAVPVAGGLLHVGVAGAPPGSAGAAVVVLVHGITGSHRAWAPVVRRLENDLTILAPDLRGRGDSAGLPGPYSMAAHAEDLVALLDHTGSSRAVVAGHSMGGYVVARLAAEAPGRLSAAVLLWAARGLQNEERPLLPPEAIADARALLPHLVVREVPDTNHYFIVLGDREAGAVAGEINRLASS